jgi:hypothetical protein
MMSPGQLLPWPGCVSEITNGRVYDVASYTDREVIGTAVPAWCARVITATTPGQILVQVHNPDSPLNRWFPPRVPAQRVRRAVP